MALAQVLDPAKELQEDHRKARDGIFELAKACEARDLRQAKQILTWIDMLAGPHWRWEEETLYPALRQFSEDLAESLLSEHDTVVEGVKRLNALFSKKVSFLGRGGLSDQEWAEAQRILPSLLYHVATCDGLPIMMEILAEAELITLKQAIFTARRDAIPLLEWAARHRKREKAASPLPQS